MRNVAASLASRCTVWKAAGESARAIASLLLLLAAGSSSACTTKRTVEPAPDACVEGQTQSCSCGGMQSIRTCGALGTYGACECALTAPQGGSGAMSGGTSGHGGESGSPVGGASGAGNGGSGAGGGGAGGANPGGEGGEGGQAGDMAGAGGEGGEGGQAGDMAGAGGEAGDTAGEGGIGGESGEGGESGDAAEPMPAQPGERYGECLEENACNTDLFCVTSSQGNDKQSSYCTPACPPDCPMPATGNVSPTCLFGICILQGCVFSGAQCPLGMTCQMTDFPTPMGTRRVTQCVFE